MKKLVLISLLCVPVLGCLTPEQAAETRATIEQATLKIDEINKEIIQVTNDYKDGKISLATFTSTVNALKTSMGVYESIKNDASSKITDWTDLLDYLLQAAGVFFGGGAGATLFSRISRGVPLAQLFKIGKTRQKE